MIDKSANILDYIIDLLTLGEYGLENRNLESENITDAEKIRRERAADPELHVIPMAIERDHA